MRSFFLLPFHFLVERLVFHPARAALGLNRCRYCYYSGTASNTSETMEFFWSVGLSIRRLYGINETCGAHSLEESCGNRKQSHGREIQGCLTRIDFSSSSSSSPGLRCLWGRHIFMGYLGMETETQSVLDKEGWLHVGDDGKETDSLLDE
ncbi:long-chain-fatty-acid-- ligase ACSBG2 isoform X2 [Pelobates cultripes]|uniref:Long-chain-fatty-acid-- ligase ACSBG2 isoform X2 n=1 Tax=Pelobates cultripes TaxID=61616 RepID=A0AAD1WBY5_PELCU|nr:long-chain-fatty-acid-- ligase ACSBG2 isoform X2 [Pelobates cultripes]